MEEIYCTYAYLREDRTPYYIGKGKKDRPYSKGKKEIRPPADLSRILILKKNLTEKEAFKHEIYMIGVFGRKDLGTGILRNRTNGGDGPSGAVRSEETKRRISELKKGNTNMLGKNHTKETKRKISEANKGHSFILGRILSEETKRKIRESNKGKTRSEETKRRISETNKKRKWWTDGITQVRCRECPGEGWINKMLKSKK